MNKWISVQDKLPDDSNGRVLCWCEEVGDLGKSEFFCICSYSKLHGFTDRLWSYKVTHWQQVTPPPKKII